jgi:hypothetical protein
VDGSGELDQAAFVERLGPFLLGRSGADSAAAAKDQIALRHLFMRIDADCGGTVDW